MILANIAGRMTVPLLALYVQNLGADVGQVGLFFTLSLIAPLFFQILGGWMSDRLGRLQAIAIGSIAGVVANVVYVLAPSWEWLLISAVGAAMGFAFVAPSFDAFIAEQSTEETRGRVYGLVMSIFPIVGVIGPLLGGFLAQYLSFRAMFMVACVLYAAAAIIRVFMARSASRTAAQAGEKAPAAAGFRASLVEIFGLVAAGGIMTWIFISDGIRDITFSMTDQLTPLYVENIMGLSLVQISSLSAVFSVVTMLFSNVGGWLSDKAGERAGIAGGFIALAIGWVIFLLGGNHLHFAIAWALWGAGNALVGPAYNVLISKVVPQRLRGTAFGLLSTSVGFIALPMPWIGAQLWEIFTPRVPFVVPLIGLMVMLPIVWFKFKLPVGKSDVEAGGEPIPAEATQP